MQLSKTLIRRGGPKARPFLAIGANHTHIHLTFSLLHNAARILTTMDLHFCACAIDMPCAKGFWFWPTCLTPKLRGGRRERRRQRGASSGAKDALRRELRTKVVVVRT